MPQPSTITVFDRYDNPHVLHVCYVTERGQNVLLVCRDPNDYDEEELMVFLQIEMGYGQYDYRLVPNEDICEDIIEEYRVMGSIEEDEDDDDKEEASSNGFEKFPTRLYYADGKADIPYDEKVVLHAANGAKIPFEVITGLSYHGKKYAMLKAEKDMPGLEKDTILFFEVGEDEGQLTVVTDDDLECALAKLSEIVLSSRDHSVDDDPDEIFEQSSADQVHELQDDDNHRYPFSVVANLDVRGGHYMILKPEFQVEGLDFDADDAFVYKVCNERDDYIDFDSDELFVHKGPKEGEDQRVYLELILDEDESDAVFAEYNKLFDARHGNRAAKTEDDDIFF